MILLVLFSSAFPFPDTLGGIFYSLKKKNTYFVSKYLKQSTDVEFSLKHECVKHMY